jgi:hypothetical protein
MSHQDHTTLPTNLREAADDLPRMSNSEEHWRFRNLMTWAADRIEALEAQVPERPPTHVRPATDYRTLAETARGDLKVSPRDWGTGARNGLREAVNLFDLLAEGKAIQAGP